MSIPSIIFTFIITLIMGGFVVLATEFPFRVAFYPLMVGIPGLIMCLAVLVRDIGRAMTGSKRLDGQTGWSGDLATEYGVAPSEVTGRFIRNLSWILVLYAMIWLLGFKVGVLAFFVLFLSVRGRARWFVIIGVTALAALFLVYFDLLLKAFWPQGILKQWLPWLP